MDYLVTALTAMGTSQNATVVAAALVGCAVDLPFQFGRPPKMDRTAEQAIEAFFRQRGIASIHRASEEALVGALEGLLSTICPAMGAAKAGLKHSVDADGTSVNSQPLTEAISELRGRHPERVKEAVVRFARLAEPLPAVQRTAVWEHVLTALTAQEVEEVARFVHASTTMESHSTLPQREPWMRMLELVYVYGMAPEMRDVLGEHTIAQLATWSRAQPSTTWNRKDFLSHFRQQKKVAYKLAEKYRLKDVTMPSFSFDVGKAKIPLRGPEAQVCLALIARRLCELPAASKAGRDHLLAKLKAEYDKRAFSSWAPTERSLIDVLCDGVVPKI